MFILSRAVPLITTITGTNRLSTDTTTKIKRERETNKRENLTNVISLQRWFNSLVLASPTSVTVFGLHSLSLTEQALGLGKYKEKLNGRRKWQLKSTYHIRDIKLVESTSSPHRQA